MLQSKLFWGPLILQVNMLDGGTDSELEVQVTTIASAKNISHTSELVEQQPVNVPIDSNNLSLQQLADPSLYPIILYLKEGKLPEDSKEAVYDIKWGTSLNESQAR